MIAHDAFRRLAALAMDGPLTDAEREALAGHRAGCKACQGYEAGLRADARALASFSPLLPPAAADARIERLLDGRPSVGRLSPAMALILIALLTAAAVGVGLAIGAFIRPSEPRLPSRPAVPAGWTVTLTQSREIRVALPPYLVPSFAAGALYANEDPNGNTLWLELRATGPQDLTQPEPGKDVVDWLLGLYPTTPRSSRLEVRSLVLPAGPATVVNTTYAPGTEGETDVWWYAISTEDGYALLEFLGRPVDFVNHAADIGLIPRLFETGPMLREALGPPAPQLILELDLPAGWFYRAGPGHTAPVDGEVGFVSNVPLPTLQCIVEPPDGEVCTLPAIDLGRDDFLLTLMRFEGGLPGYDPAASPLPDGVERVTIGGRPATREISEPGGDPRRSVSYQLGSPGGSGFWILALNAGPDDFDSVRDRIEVMLAQATFVHQD